MTGRVVASLVARANAQRGSDRRGDPLAATFEDGRARSADAHHFHFDRQACLAVEAVEVGLTRGRGRRRRRVDDAEATGAGPVAIGALGTDGRASHRLTVRAFTTVDVGLTRRRRRCTWTADAKAHRGDETSVVGQACTDAQIAGRAFAAIIICEAVLDGRRRKRTAVTGAGRVIAAGLDAGLHGQASEHFAERAFAAIGIA